MSGKVGPSIISAIRSNASSVCSSRKRACTWVDSLEVAALADAPMPSIFSEISIAEKRSVPLKRRCSRKCESPSWPSASSRDPVRTHSPRATDRTEGTTSVTTRTPLESVVSWTFSGSEDNGATRLRNALEALAASSASATVAVAPAAATVTAAVAATSSATVTTAATAATGAGADGGELLGRLALDGGVLGEPQADPAALAVDLDHGHLDLVALAQDVLDGVDPLARLHVRDVKQAVGALDELDERAEGGRLDDLALERVADLRVARHRLDAGDAGVDLSAGGRVDANRAVVVDVDLGLELLLHAADRLAALADDRA